MSSMIVIPTKVYHHALAHGFIPYRDKLYIEYLFDNQTVNDTSGNNRHGVISGPEKFSVGEIGDSQYSFRVDNGNAYISIPFEDTRTWESASVSMWVKWDGFTFSHGEAYLAFGSLYIANHYTWKGDWIPPYRYYFVHVNKDCDIQKTIPVPNEDKYNWVHLGLTADNSTKKVRGFRNGQLVVQFSYDVDNLMNTLFCGSGNRFIFRHGWGCPNPSNYSNRMIGNVDMVRIWKNVALEPSDMELVYFEDSKKYRLSLK